MTDESSEKNDREVTMRHNKKMEDRDKADAIYRDLTSEQQNAVHWAITQHRRKKGVPEHDNVGIFIDDSLAEVLLPDSQTPVDETLAGIERAYKAYLTKSHGVGNNSRRSR